MKWYAYTQLAFTFLLILFIPHGACASTTDGIIDSTFKYAWSTNAGWINFAASAGNVHITDATITGYAWSDNYGWINLNPTQSGISNDDEGNLDGFAWGALLGWIDFSDVSIDDSGNFQGTATGPIIGTLSFDCTHCTVSTDWRPVSIRSLVPVSSSSGGGGGGNGPPIVSFVESVNLHLPAVDTIASSSLGTTEDTPLVKAIARVIPRFPDLGTQPVLPLGASSENIRTLQIFLNALGFTLAKVGPGSPGSETSIFGPLTKAALTKFQIANDIVPATGYFGPKTRAFIATLPLVPSVPIQTDQVDDFGVVPDFVFTRDLKYGMSGSDVTALQQLLIVKNAGLAAEALSRSGTSAYFGRLTKAAVVEYQQKHGITPAVGYFGPVTQKNIRTP